MKPLVLLLAASTGTLVVAEVAPIPGGEYTQLTALGCVCTALIFLLTKTIPAMTKAHADSLDKRDAVLHEMADAVKTLTANCAARAEQHRKENNP